MTLDVLDGVAGAQFDPDNIADWLSAVDAEQERIRRERGGVGPRRFHDPKTEFFKGQRLYFRELSQDSANKHIPSRVAYYCWAMHNRDGHCPLEDGELQRLMGKPGLRNAEAMRSWIKPAIALRMLGEESVLTCLVTPPGAWFDYGPRTKWCDHHRQGRFKPVPRGCFGDTAP